MLEFAKAKIHVLEGSRSGTEIEVLFNPGEYSLEVSNNFRESAVAGLDDSLLQFVNGVAGTLTMELYFDTYTDDGGSDVTARTDEIAQLMRVDSATHAPPKVEFRWGSVAFRAVVEKLSQRFVMFRSDGVPVRARLTVTFRGHKALAEQLRSPRRNSADKTKRRVLSSDSSVWLIANQEYRDPRCWRLIARENRIDDPSAIRPGTVLVVPPLDDSSGRKAP
ncbi:MAG: hypothetical protein JWO25_945 [Alphaproteobacteria bacterium]|nr:hypothetical protein [Alphaproteobacteria bacterium]MDB5719936.1 hypothetical protein [Alphaproteobacteria bacterium]